MHITVLLFLVIYIFLCIFCLKLVGSMDVESAAKKSDSMLCNEGTSALLELFSALIQFDFHVQI